MNSKIVWAIVIVAVIAAIFVFSMGGGVEEQTEFSNVPAESGSEQDTSTDSNVEEDSSNDGTSSNPTWMEIELEDVATGEKFKISDFSGKPVLLESFAVWCPKCKRQQQEVKAFHEEVGDSVVSVAINTDSNEDAETVLNYIEENEFGWYYAVSPDEMNQALIDEFGPGILSAPSVPMILICEDGRFRMLGSGNKDVDELKEAVESCGA